MASSSSLLSEQQFLCSICLDVFTDPVSIQCGHNFCMACIRGYWDTSELCKCPLCQETFYRRPELHVNTAFREVVEHFKRMEEECGERKAQLGKMKAEVQQMIQKRLQKHKEIKHSMELNNRDAERELADGIQVFTALKLSIERSQAELLEVRQKQKATERQAEGLIKELGEEITELKKRSTELEELSHTEDHLHLLQSFPSLSTPSHTKDWSEISVHRCLYTGTVRRVVSQLKETLMREVKKLDDVDLKMIQQYAVDVTMDLDTAHPSLYLSGDGKQVRKKDTQQCLPDTPERFNPGVNILGKQGFSSTRFYYEVEVKGKTAWDLGVARESINRKGDITLSPSNGYWTVLLRSGIYYQANAATPVSLSLTEKPQKVGVFVDYEEGQVSFYDVEARSRIYSFTGCTFTEKLYPFFSPHLNIGGKNSAPLIITPVTD